MHTITTLGHADAQRAIAVIQAELSRLGKSGVIAVADASGELLALLRLDGAPLPSITVAINKCFTAVRERKPSGDIGKAMREKNFHIAYFGDTRNTGFGGGLPVMVNGVPTGAVAVSGLSEEEDVKLAEMGVAAIMNPSR